MKEKISIWVIFGVLVACLIFAVGFAVSAHAKDIVITWEPSPEAVSYMVYVAPFDRSGTERWRTEAWTKTAEGVTETTYTVQGLADDREWAVLVYAVDSEGDLSKVPSNMAGESPKRPPTVIDLHITGVIQ